MHEDEEEEEEEEEEVWNDIILAVEFQLVHTAVHKAALQPSQECKLQATCSSSGATGDAPAGEECCFLPG